MNLFGRRAAALVAVAVAAVVATGRVEATTPTATPPPGAAIQRLDPAYQSVSLAQASFPVDLRVEGAANLGAFEVLLTFDSADVSFLSFSNGPFLGSTGRTALCLPPVVQLLPGTLRKLQIGCGTIGAPPPPGPTGNGLLATVWFAPLAPGLTDLSLEPSLSDPFGAAAFAVAYGAQVDIAPGPTPTFTLTPTPTNTATPCPPAGCPTPTPVLCAPTVVSAPASVPGSPAAAFDVPISVEHVCELGAFAFSVAFDPARLVFVSAAASGFLGSTGRTVQCVPVQSLPGDVRLSCVTLGAPPPQGASGTGVLAVLRFIGAQNGLAAIDVHDVSLLQPNAAVIPATETDGSADITPCGACPTVTPTQASTSTPTAAPTNTPTATPTATPCPGSCPSPTLPPAPATPTPTVPAGPAALRVAPAAITAPQGSVAAAAIVVDGATNLGAFSFVATWDPAHAALASVSPGAFLGSTGRPVFCSQTFAGLPPGAVRYSCGSLGATLSGPGGSGVLATLHLTVGAPGTMPLSLSNIAFTTPAAVPLPVGSISGGVITIISCGGPCPTATATPISSPTPVLTPSGVAFVSASPASFNVVPGDVFETAIMVANVSNLGAFDVTFEYNTPPGVTLALESWTPGPFLGSTGRPVFCQPPVLDNFDVRVGCATFGSAAAGPSGGGELGRLSFRALSFGIISSFGVQSAELGDPLAAGIAVQWPGPSTVIVSPAPSPTPEAGGGSGSMSAGGGGSATGASSNGARTSWGRGVPPLLLFALAFAAILVAMRMPRGLARTVRPAAALAAGAIALAALAGGGAESGVQLRPEPYAVNVVAGGDAVSVDQAITGTGNHDVASFELRYRFDPSVISVAFADGGYLGSGGRDVSCTTDTVTYFERLISCTTSGSGSGAFATGDGTLVQASIAVAVAVDAAQLSDGGLSAVHIQSLEILDSDGSPLFVEGTFDIGVQVHALAGDADGDCAIDDADLQQVLASYGAYGGSPDYAAVLDAEPDGDVDVHDVQTVLGRLSATCGAPLPPPPPPPPLPVPAALTDFDGDGVLSGADDCPDIADSDQSDGDDDYLGDACEASHGTNGADADTDDDGCLDGIEVHRERFPPSVGGDRDPTSAWDFFDVTGDRAIDLADTLNVLSYFGDPGLSSTPGDLRDRDIFASAQPWQTDESDDGIDLADALVNLQSFGHNCSASP